MRYSFLILILLISHCGISQNNLVTMLSDQEQLGDKYFQKYAFADALEFYQSALGDDQENSALKLKIAECYRYLNDPEQASRWYGKVFESTQDVDVNVMLKYADALTGFGEYEEARTWYEKYKNLTGDDALVNDKIQAIESREKLYRNTGSVQVEKANFNSGFADFSPAYFQNGLVFVSARPKGKKKNETFNWDKSEYLDIYVVGYDNSVELFSDVINSKYHEGPLVFFDDDNKLIFTRDNYENGKLNKSTDGITKLKLYFSEKNRTTGQWMTPEPLPFNSDEYSVGHPTISKDGKTLYFVSDMPGGHGGTDLYKSNYQDNQWQEPVNLGANINTAGNEMFPFLHNDKELFFASNGHGGLGGLDLFVLDIAKGYESTVNNLGAPVNSNFDDFGLILSERGDNGYFSSNREGGRNLDNIYAFKTERSFLQQYRVRGRVLSEIGKEPVGEATVTLSDKEGTVISSQKSGAEGEFSFSVDPDQEYQLIGSKEEFFENKLIFKTEVSEREEWTYDLYLMNNYSFVLVGEMVEKGSEKPVEGVQVKITDNFTGREILNASSDPEGFLSYVLADKKIHERISYYIEMEKEGYLRKSFVLNDSLAKPGPIYLKEYFDLSFDKIDVGMDIGKLVDVKPIYFDLGKSTIRKDAAQELDKIVKIMKENPRLEIELGSHTDARGSATSNHVLSDKRAKASAEYIISKGIEASRITGKGYGESQLLNECGDQVSCAEEKHQENRRTEFKVLKF